MNLELNENTIVRQIKDELLASDLGDELIFMNLESGDYYGLNNVGSSIWKMIESPIAIKFITKNLMQSYNIEKDQCEAKIMEFIQELHDEKMIEIL